MSGRIFSADCSEIEANMGSVPIYLRQSMDNLELEFAERRHQKPEALLRWCIPGRLTGLEFLYSPRPERKSREMLNKMFYSDRWLLLRG
jgi:hypothetical protein